MFKIANKKLFKYVSKIFSRPTFKLINKNSFSLNHFKNFCVKENIEENENIIEEKLSSKIINKNLNLSKLTINILKYLERNFELYQKLCEDAIKLSYDLSESPDGNDFLRTELMRINRQIGSFSKDNYYYDEFRKVIREIDSNIELLQEAIELNDEEIKKSVTKDIEELRIKLEEMQSEIIEYFIPDETESINVVSMEVKAAAGGTEGALFAEDLVNMYKALCLKMGFEFNTVLYSTDFAYGKGCKNGTFKIRGESVYKYFQYESGVHKVQRVPITEKMGRIHSSTCQVAIFADKTFEYEDINERDLRIEYMRAGGAGGQHVNKTESAVRITHIPTGVVVQNQNERDQHRNKAKAMEVLRGRIFSKQLSNFKTDINDSRRSQQGSGNLSEKIRTYNWPDSRVTDHRIGMTLYGIDQMLEGTHLETILEKLIENERIKKLNEVLNRINEQ